MAVIGVGDSGFPIRVWTVDPHRSAVRFQQELHVNQQGIRDTKRVLRILGFSSGFGWDTSRYGFEAHRLHFFPESFGKGVPYLDDLAETVNPCHVLAITELTVLPCSSQRFECGRKLCEGNVIRRCGYGFDSRGLHVLRLHHSIVQHRSRLSGSSWYQKQREQGSHHSRIPAYLSVEP